MDAADTYAVTPSGPVAWRGTVPGSKSLSARALVAAALAGGESTLSNVLRCDDTRYLAQALTACGLLVSFGEDADGPCTVRGLGGAMPVRRGAFFLGNAGTAMRFLTAVLTLAEGDYELDGAARMRRRPIGALTAALRALGADVVDSDGFPPVTIGAAVLRGGRAEVPGSQSSQFTSALLLAGPYSREGIEVQVTGDVLSRPYLDLTCDVMAAFGCPPAVREDPLIFRVAPGVYQARDWAIEADASSASYFFAAAAVTGGEATVTGIGRRSRQGDLAFLDVLERMGCAVRRGENEITVRGGDLAGVEVDAGAFPDVVPTIAACALFARGATEIRGVPHLRIKESDRIASVAAEFGKLGARIEERADGLRIEGRAPLAGEAIATWDDHRIAMSAAVVGLRVPGVVIRGAGVVSKSFPGFFEAWSRLGRRGA